MWLPLQIKLYRRMGLGAKRSATTPPPRFGQLRFFGQKEKFGLSHFLKKCVIVSVTFYQREIVSVVRPVKFTSDSTWWASGYFKGDHMYIIAIFGHRIALHYAVCVGHFQSWKTRVNFSKLSRIILCSELRRMKTYLRNTMRQQRVCNIALINTERGYMPTLQSTII